MPTRIAVVPARGGSKRIPDKNIRDFCGQPMIGHIIQAAARSGLFNAIHVSTESQRIADVARSLGHPVEFMRPNELADDHTPLMPVLRHVVETYRTRGKRFDEVWLLMACAPLIEATDLKEAAELFASLDGKNSVVAVAHYPVPVEWAFRRRPDGRLDPLQPEMHAVRSQDIEPAYFDTGTFYIHPAEHVLCSEGAGDYRSYVGYLLAPRKAIDIDSEEDLSLAEVMFKARPS